MTGIETNCAVGLGEGDRSRLEALSWSSAIRAGLALRARIVLLAAENLANAEIARRTGRTSLPAVVDWRARSVAGIRQDTSTLFAAFEVATGRVEQLCQPRHRHQEFLRFLMQVAKAYLRSRSDRSDHRIHQRLERTLPTFVWTTEADIIAKAHRKPTSGTRHQIPDTRSFIVGW